MPNMGPPCKLSTANQCIDNIMLLLSSWKSMVQHVTVVGEKVAEVLRKPFKIIATKLFVWNLCA